MSCSVARAALLGMVGGTLLSLGVFPARVQAAQGPAGSLSVVIAADASGHAVTCTAFSTADPTKLAVGQSECKVDLSGSPSGWTPGQVIFALYLQCSMTGDSGTCALDPSTGNHSVAAFAWNPGSGTSGDAVVLTGFSDVTGTLVNTANGPQLNVSGVATLSQTFADNAHSNKTVPFTVSTLTDQEGHTTINFSPGPLCTTASCASTFGVTPWIVSCTGCLFEAGTPYGITTTGTPTGTAGGSTSTSGSTSGGGTSPSGSGTTTTPNPFVLVGVSRNGLGVTPWFRVYFTSPSAGRGEVLFGSGPGCLGLIGTATMDQTPGTNSHVITVMGDELHPGVGLTPGATYSYETVTIEPAGTTIDNNGGKCYTVTVPKS